MSLKWQLLQKTYVNALSHHFQLHTRLSILDYKTDFKNLLNFYMVEYMCRQSFPGKKHLKMYNNIRMTYI